MTISKHRIFFFIFIIITGIIILLYRIIPPQGYVEDTRFLLDTVVSITLYKSRDRELLEKAFARIDTLEKKLSRYSPESDISRINFSGTGGPVKVARETIEVLNLALDYARLSNGAFDPTIGPLVDLWDIGGEHPRVPETAEITNILPLVNYNKIQVEKEPGTVTLKTPGMLLDIGGIAKGWIADNINDFLHERGAKYILINLGGNIRVSGGKSKNENFNIGMQDPFGERGNYLGIFTLSSGSVVSSGLYERYFESNGIRYHHLFDTETGRPINNGLAAVTVISPLSADGDALSTSLFALGTDTGLELATALDDIEAAFITVEGSIILTPGAAELFKPTRKDLEIQVAMSNNVIQPIK